VALPAALKCFLPRFLPRFLPGFLRRCPSRRNTTQEAPRIAAREPSRPLTARRNDSANQVSPARRAKPTLRGPRFLGHVLSPRADQLVAFHVSPPSGGATQPRKRLRGPFLIHSLLGLS
jgi:hypothetical protein